MKSVFLLSLMCLSTFAYSASDWKVVAVTTTSCKEKVQVMAKDGEKFVRVTDGSNETKLFAEDGSAFSEQNAKAVVYSNKSDKSLTAKHFTFTQPAMVDGNPPKIEIATNGVKDHCKLSLK